MFSAPVWPRGWVCAWLAASVAITATMFAQGVQAQTPAPTNAPKTKGAAPKVAPEQATPPPAVPTAAGPAPNQQVPRLSYEPWTKFCLKGQDTNAKQVCITGKAGRIESSGQPAIAVAIIEPEGQPKKILRVTLPLGMQLVHGTRVIVDNNAPAQSPFAICFPNGCVSDYELTPDMLVNLKKGQNLFVQAINSDGSPLTLPLPLQETAGGFAKAYDGPPTDPKVLEENQKKLQEELQKRGEEAGSRPEAAPPADAAAAAPAR